MFDQPKKMFAGHTKVLVGSYVARGPDVAQTGHFYSDHTASAHTVKLGYNRIG